MTGGAKGLTIGLVVVSAVTTFAAVTFYMGRSAEQAKRLWAESQLEETLRLKAALEQEKQELTKTTEELEIKVRDLQGTITTLEAQAQQLSDQIASEKRTAETLRIELEGSKQQVAAAQTRLDAERREKLTMADDVVKAKGEATRLQEELKQLRQAKDALERRVKAMMSEDGASDVILVTPTGGGSPVPHGGAGPGGGAAAAMTEGRVLVVNREFNFLVVNLGEREGLKSGQFLQIVRGDQQIARVQVERVYDNMAAANILPEATRENIKEGDQVRR